MFYWAVTNQTCIALVLILIKIIIQTTKISQIRSWSKMGSKCFNLAIWLSLSTFIRLGNPGFITNICRVWLIVRSQSKESQKLTIFYHQKVLIHRLYKSSWRQNIWYRVVVNRQYHQESSTTTLSRECCQWSKKSWIWLWFPNKFQFLTLRKRTKKRFFSFLLD